MRAEAAAFPVLAKDEFTGKQFGRFEVLCKLGDGGMSQVFLAWQKSVGGFRRAVVLKRILESIRHDKDFLRMFVQEAKITSGLSHGNIAALYDLAHEANELFMVMEFVPGATLVEIARACAVAREPIPLGLSLSVVRDTAVALHYAHTFKDPSGRARPVIHRDIAEKNIMVALDGSTKLLDFGIARQQGRLGLTQVGMVKGTAGYMSPEQVRGEELDGRTDVFSLGVVLHECLTGQRLFRRDTRAEEVAALLNDPIAAPSQRNRLVSIALDSVVMKALSRDRSHRFANARELALAIDRAGSAQLWDAEQRSAFILKHFAPRQSQIEQLLGDPARTDLGELEADTDGGRSRDSSKTMAVSRVATPAPMEAAAAATLGADEDSIASLSEGNSDDWSDGTVIDIPPPRSSAPTVQLPFPPWVIAIAGAGTLLLILAGVLWLL